MKPITIVGTGAMALFFGSRLAAAGLKVQLLGTWSAGVDAIQRDGIRVQEKGQISCYQAPSAREGELPFPVENALVLVKSWQTTRAAKQLCRLLNPGGAAVTLQNGLGNIEVLQSYLGEDRSAQGVTTYGATLVGPGIVRPAGEGVVTIQEHPRLDPLLHALQDSGIKIQLVGDLSSLVWGKLIINVAINPLTALLEIRNGQLLDSPAAVQIMGLAAREAAAVATSLGIKLTFQDPAGAAEAVAQATGENFSSMLQDIHRGAPTEIQALCGEVVRCGKEVGQPTPVNKLFHLLVQAKVERKEENYEQSSQAG